MKHVQDKSNPTLRMVTQKLMSGQIRAKQPYSTGILEGRRKSLASFLSGSYHSAFFKVSKPITPISPLEKGALVISVDIDVGSKELGLINEGRNDLDVSSRLSEYAIGEIEEVAVPELVQLFDTYKMPVTFAVRGQLTEVPDSVLVELLKSPVSHDIGAHGYYHRRFRSLSYNEAEAEIKMISRGMQRFGLTPKSFVFPRNSVAHLRLLEEYGYECYRDWGDFLHDSMCIRKDCELWEVHPTLAIDQHTKFVFLKEILDVAIRRRLPMHLWFHARDFGKEYGEIKRNLRKVFLPFLDYSSMREEEGVLTFETMLSAARIVRAHTTCSHSSNMDQ